MHISHQKAPSLGYHRLQPAARLILSRGVEAGPSQGSAWLSDLAGTSKPAGTQDPEELKHPPAGSCLGADLQGCGETTTLEAMPLCSLLHSTNIVLSPPRAVLRMQGEGDKEDGQGPTPKGLRVGGCTGDGKVWVAHRGWEDTEAGAVGGSFRWGWELACEIWGKNTLG